MPDRRSVGGRTRRTVGHAQAGQAVVPSVDGRYSRSPPDARPWLPAECNRSERHTEIRSVLLAGSSRATDEGIAVPEPMEPRKVRVVRAQFGVVLDGESGKALAGRDVLRVEGSRGQESVGPIVTLTE